MREGANDCSEADARTLRRPALVPDKAQHHSRNPPGPPSYPGNRGTKTCHDSQGKKGFGELLFAPDYTVNATMVRWINQEIDAEMTYDLGFSNESGDLEGIYKDITRNRVCGR